MASSSIVTGIQIIVSVAIVGAAVSQTALGAQTANPAGMAPDTPGAETGRPTPEHANTADQLFMRQITLGGTQEVALAKLAQRRAQSPGVKEFAQRMAQDHGKANDLASGLAKANAVQPRGQPDMDHAVMRQQLEQLKGDAFDRAYIRGQVQEHQKTALLLEWEIGSGQDPRVRNFAIETLPTVMGHLEMAKRLLSQLTGAS
jgi:putative membrane protein